MLRRQIRRLRKVGGKIVELRRLLRQVHQLPPAFAHRAQLPIAPEQPLVWRATLFTREIREQIHAVVAFVRRHRRPRRRERRGKHVHRTHRPVVRAPRRNLPRPRHEKRHAHAALVNLAFLPAQGCVDRAVRRQRPPIVTEEKHQRPLRLPRLAQRPERLADRVVHQTHLGRIGPPFRIRDRRQARQPLRRRFVRRVRRVERQIEKPRLTRMPPHKRRRLLPQRRRQVLRRLHRHPVALDRHRVFDRGVRFPVAKLVTATDEPERFLKAPLARRKFRRRPEVPLAHPARRITRPHEVRRQQRLRKRQAFRVIARVVKRIPLVTEALLVTPRHQPRPRRTAKRMGHIPARKPHTRLREPVEMRRRNFLRPLKARIRVALVVGDDQQHVGSPHLRRHGHRRDQPRQHQHDSEG